MQTQREKSVVKIDEKKGQVRLTTRLPIDLAKSLKYMAIDKNTSVNALVIQALKELVNTHNKK
jgi:predicted HicB family RNase H-like nuclease